MDYDGVMVFRTKMSNKGGQKVQIFARFLAVFIDDKRKLER